MSTATGTLLYGNTTDAEFRAWGSAIASALAAIGLVQTADTGQINWSTVLKPSGSSTAQGYEIWRFNDALQGTAPVFIKVEYGSSSAAALAAGVWLTVGTGTNGAGTLTGTISTRTANSEAGSGTTAAVYASPWYACGDTSSATFASTSSHSAGVNWVFTFCFTVERSRDADGTPNGDGVMISSMTTASTTVNQVLSFTSASASSASTVMPIPMYPTRLNQYNTGANVVIFPLVMCTPKTQQGSPLGIVGCGFNDFVRLSEVQATINGSTHTFKAFKPGGARSAYDGTTPIGLLMRWE